MEFETLLWTFSLTVVLDQSLQYFAMYLAVSTNGVKPPHHMC